MLPEVAALDRSGSGSFVRIPPSVDVPMTRRVRRLVDSNAMARLRSISQLGMVGLVYPGATHSRLEHTLGVYHNALRLLGRFAGDARVTSMVDERMAEAFILASLLHDVGHWPYCHPIEDMRLTGIPHHEAVAEGHVSEPQIARILEKQWGVEPSEIGNFLTGQGKTIGLRALQNVLNGPVDIDKMDYLQRDSLHAGVPYGRNFDQARLIGSLTVDPSNAKIGITEKGKTAAEMMVFSRYVMFSEVYWHHAVRSATAMLQRLVFSLHDSIDVARWSMQSDLEFAQTLTVASSQDPWLSQLGNGIFGSERGLYKRLAQYSFADSQPVFEAIAGRSYGELVSIAERLACRLSEGLQSTLSPLEVLIDAPPAKREVQFDLPVRQPTGRHGATFISLAAVSPVVRSLATEQFDNFVKQVRVFVAPSRVEQLSTRRDEIESLLLECAER